MSSLEKLECRLLVATVELSTVVQEEGLTLRLEIFESLTNSGWYAARVWRLEHYRLQPTFPQRQGIPAHEPSDEVILKEFEGLDTPSAAAFASLELARDAFLRQVTDWIQQIQGH